MATEPNGRLIDLDALDREVVDPGYRREKIGFNIKGMQVYLTDPKELPWDVVVTMDETPRRFFATAIEDQEQKRHMLDLETPVKMWQLQYIMEQYRAHYGIDSQGNAVGSRR